MTPNTETKQLATAPKAATPMASPQLVASQKFIQKVEQHFKAQLGMPVVWSPLQLTLAQHLFVKVDYSMRKLREEGKSKADWNNINLDKLALDSVGIVAMKVDANLKNHVNVIPYWNDKTKQYDVEPRLGYEGMMHARIEGSVDPILNVSINLVYAGDSFSVGVHPSGGEYPLHVKANPLNPGEVVEGGYGWIQYEDPRKNRVEVVTLRDFKRSEAAAQTNTFWKANPIEMREKTVVFRTCEKIRLDPAKINASVFEQMAMNEFDNTITMLEDRESQLAHQETLTVGTAPALEAVTDDPKDEIPSSAEPVATSTQDASTSTTAKTSESPKAAPKSRGDDAAASREKLHGDAIDRGDSSFVDENGETRNTSNGELVIIDSGPGY